MEDDIAVIGLGYVGLPLAIELAKQFDVIGFDISSERIERLKQNKDLTGVVSPASLESSRVALTSAVTDIFGRAIYIVTVPTPVNELNFPNLTALREACKIVGLSIKKGAIVVFESTVYPGVTEDICGAEIERSSGLISGQGFFLGYSPERINPGDKDHTVSKITKIVSGQTDQVVEKLSKIYGSINNDKICPTKNIRTAEAAKVIENAQRDINIAFINEVAMICNKNGLSTQEVLAAARTKWNFLDFVPGLVGGHCIGVDPYYLAHWSIENGYNPEVILAGRRINDRMALFVAEQIHKQLHKSKQNILMLGLSFKANVADLRNSKSAELSKFLEKKGHEVKVHDPFVDKKEAKKLYGIKLIKSLTGNGAYDCVIGAVSHELYASFGASKLSSLVKKDGLLVDLMGMWHKIELPSTIFRWEL